MAFVSRASNISEAVEIFFKQSAIHNILAAHTLNNPFVFRKWEIIKSASPPDQEIRTIHEGHNMIVKRDSGVGTVTFGIFESTDDITYSSFISGGTTNASEIEVAGGSGSFFIDAAINFIKIQAHNSNGATTGTIRNFIADIMMYLPPGITLSRLV